MTTAHTRSVHYSAGDRGQHNPSEVKSILSFKAAARGEFRTTDSRDDQVMLAIASTFGSAMVM